MSSIRVCALLCLLFVASVSCAAVVEDTILPQHVKICKQSDSDYSACLKNAIQDSWATFIQGIPKLNTPVLDPFEIDAVEDSFEAGDLFKGHMVLRDIKIYGLTRTKVADVRPQISDDQVKLELDVEIPKVLIECDYRASGAVGSFDVSGKGHFNISMTGLTATWALDGHVKDDRWVVEHFRINPQIKGMRVFFSDARNGDNQLNEIAMAITNQYWPIFFEAMKPIIRELSDSRLSNFVNELVFSKVPASKIFPK